MRTARRTATPRTSAARSRRTAFVERDDRGQLVTIPVDEDAADAVDRAEDARYDAIEAARRFYGDEAAKLVADGWTVDAAANHVQGACDVNICTHPMHETLHISADELSAALAVGDAGGIFQRLSYQEQAAWLIARMSGGSHA